MSFVEKYEMVLADIPSHEVESYIANELGLDKKGGKYRCIWHAHKNPYKVTFCEQGKFFKCHDTIDSQVVYGLRNLLQDDRGMSAAEVLSFMDNYFCGGKFSAGSTKGAARETENAKRKQAEMKHEKEKQEAMQSKRQEIDAILNDSRIGNAIGWLKEERGVVAKLEHNMPIAQLGNNIYYLYKNLAGEVVNVKVRKPNKKFEVIKAAEKFLPYNFENCTDHTKPLYLVEGEADCLALYSLGYQTTTMGASNATELLNQNYDEVNKFKTIVLVLDNDEAGAKAAEKIKELLPRVLEVKKDYYYGLKDVNEILVKQGEAAVRKMIENGIHMGDNVVSARNVKTTKEIGKKVKTIFEDLNAIIGSWRKGTINVISGGSGSGKTTFVNQAVILSHLLAGEKVFWYNAEFKNDIGLKNFLQCVTKKQDDFTMDLKGYKKGKARYEFGMKEEAFERLKKCVDENLYIYKDSILNDPAMVFAEIEKYARITGIKTIVIDNLMCLKSRDIEDDNRAVTMLMMKLKELANELGLAIFIVAHTKKGQKGMESQESIAGTSNVGNLADTVLIVSRTLDDKEMINYYVSKNTTTIPPKKDEPTINSMKVIVDKNRNDGDTDQVEFVFDKKQRRYDVGSGAVFDTDYEAELLKLLGKQKEEAKEIELEQDDDFNIDDYL